MTKKQRWATALTAIAEALGGGVTFCGSETVVRTSAGVEHAGEEQLLVEAPLVGFQMQFSPITENNLMTVCNRLRELLTPEVIRKMNTVAQLSSLAQYHSQVVKILKSEYEDLSGLQRHSLMGMSALRDIAAETDLWRSANDTLEAFINDPEQIRLGDYDPKL